MAAETNINTEVELSAPIHLTDNINIELLCDECLSKGKTTTISFQIKLISNMSLTISIARWLGYNGWYTYNNKLYCNNCNIWRKK